MELQVIGTVRRRKGEQEWVGYVPVCVQTSIAIFLEGPWVYEGSHVQVYIHTSRLVSTLST